MSNQLLWSFDRLAELLGDEDVHVRRWAVERLTKLFPNEAAHVLLDMIIDPDKLIRINALEFLQNYGDAAVIGPIITKRMGVVDCDNFGMLAEALALMGYQEGLPVVVDHLAEHNRSRRIITREEFYSLVTALGIWGGEEARSFLWTVIEKNSGDNMMLSSLVDALLRGGMPEDASGLAACCRLQPSVNAASRIIKGFASSVGVSRLLDELEADLENGLDDALESAKWWLVDPPALSEECLAELKVSAKKDFRDALNVMWRESIRLTQDRGENSVKWVEDWISGNRPSGYRQRAVITQFTLMAFAANESGNAERRRHEVALGLAMLCQMSVDVDDEAVYQSSDDKTAALVDILSSNRENVLDDIVKKVGALGPGIVPSLIDKFDPMGLGWGCIRIARAIEHIARRNPGSCEGAIPRLMEAICPEQGDFMLEACADALGAIGPAAVEHIAPHLTDDDSTRRIFFRAALRDIPTESSAQAVLNAISPDESLDEMDASALFNIGSPSGIEPIRDEWEYYGTSYLPAYLLVLSRINGIDHPDIPKWREAAAKSEKRQAQCRAFFDAAVAIPTATSPSPSSGHTSSKTKKVISDAERKKRKAHRKINARKKKK